MYHLITQINDRFFCFVRHLKLGLSGLTARSLALLKLHGVESNAVDLDANWENGTTSLSFFIFVLSQILMAFTEQVLGLAGFVLCVCVHRGLDNYLSVKQVTLYTSNEPWAWYKPPAQ